MEHTKVLNSLGFNEAWIELGILPSKLADSLVSDYLISDDKRTEHYRWRAFDNFMRENLILEESKLLKVYDLVKSEKDHMLQDSMIHTLIRRADLPIVLLEKETVSEVKSIAKKAKEKFEERKRTQET